ncbi:hypothetical protein EV193_1197 [Herbihabitans rhizosphaerae]|uniref:DUF1795 domain-containing protein n=1 Tax=Herbihabitans rhizosphaerae TaxID=1872711 RepID=A0A4Q7KBT5_9PSEU|nr:hypothetical protein [Herbihabitans rhizosphaerae]RZS29604.1 hypothetical protein EV193_1197 [Herbihabitans rhizosphaerae]
MATQLPVRIEFALPGGWQAVSPDESGAPHAAFVAVHLSSADGFTANITISGQIREPELTLARIADDSVAQLEESLESAKVRQRVEEGSLDAPGLSQVVDLVAEVNGQSRELVQCQAYLSMADVRDPDLRAVIELALTCTRGQLETVFADFQSLVASVRPTDDSAAAQ